MLLCVSLWDKALNRLDTYYVDDHYLARYALKLVKVINDGYQRGMAFGLY